jgi:acyl dehydratase
MPIDRKFVGVESEDRYVDVEKGQLRFFAEAVGERNPIYSDESAAQRAGYPTLPAPPTFAFSLGLLAPPRTGSIEDLGVNIGNVLHGEQRFTYHAPIHAGDRMRLRTKTVDIYEKKGGALEFIVQDTTAHNQDDILCVSTRTIVVVRH